VSRDPERTRRAAIAVDGPTDYLRGPKDARPTRAELLGVPYVAPMIVEGYLQQDAAGFVAPGGYGKSTVLLYEAAHIITGRPLYGREIVRPGGVLAITAEDSRAVTLSRMNQVCNALDLSKRDQSKILRHFYVEDVSASPAKLVEADPYGIEPTRFLDEIIAKYSDAGLAASTVDPVALLGPGEMSGNDGMAQFMRTARMLGNGLNAAVRLIHHVAQAVARGGIKDQYAGRGGTAFADNSRGQHQLARLTERKLEYEGSSYTLPAEVTDADLASGNVLAIFVHKLSYAIRDSTPIIVVRNGFAFRHLPIERLDESPLAQYQKREAELHRVVEFISERLAAGIKISRNELDGHAAALGMTRLELRTARDGALHGGLLIERKLPVGERIKRRTSYLSPAGATAAEPTEPAKAPKAAKPAKSRHKPPAALRTKRTGRAAKAAADGTSIRRRLMKLTNALPARGSPAGKAADATARKKRLNGQEAPI